MTTAVPTGFKRSRSVSGSLFSARKYTRLASAVALREAICIGHAVLAPARTPVAIGVLLARRCTELDVEAVMIDLRQMGVLPEIEVRGVVAKRLGLIGWAIARGVGLCTSFRFLSACDARSKKC